MAKSKYVPETVDRIIGAIARDGCDESGWLAGGIKERTFYEWQVKFPQFQQLVAHAKEEFRKYCPEEQSRLAREKLTQALTEGQTIRRRSSRKMKIEHFSANGDLIWYQLHDEEKQNDDIMPPPKWAIDRVLPKPLNTIEQILAAASEYGCTLVVKDADLFNRYLQEASGNDSKGDSKQGLTEEEAAAIRAKILGLAE